MKKKIKAGTFKFYEEMKALADSALGNQGTVHVSALTIGDEYVITIDDKEIMRGPYEKVKIQLEDAIDSEEIESMIKSGKSDKDIIEKLSGDEPLSEEEESPQLMESIAKVADKIVTENADTIVEQIDDGTKDIIKEYEIETDDAKNEITLTLGATVGKKLKEEFEARYGK